MGMDLYASSPAARRVWDAADAHMSAFFGFSILDIVRRNPKELIVHFGGRRGAQLRRSYLALTTEGVDGRLKPLLPEVTPTSRSFTFRADRGLLFATQFTQVRLSRAPLQLSPSSPILTAPHSLPPPPPRPSRRSCSWRRPRSMTCAPAASCPAASCSRATPSASTPPSPRRATSSTWRAWPSSSSCAALSCSRRWPATRRAAAPTACWPWTRAAWALASPTMPCTRSSIASKSTPGSWCRCVVEPCACAHTRTKR